MTSAFPALPLLRFEPSLSLNLFGLARIVILLGVLFGVASYHHGDVEQHQHTNERHEDPLASWNHRYKEDQQEDNVDKRKIDVIKRLFHVLVLCHHRLFPSIRSDFTISNVHETELYHASGSMT